MLIKKTKMLDGTICKIKVDELFLSKLEKKELFDKGEVCTKNWSGRDLQNNLIDSSDYDNIKITKSNYLALMAVK